MSIVIYCWIQNSIQSQLKSWSWHEEVQPLRLFKQDLLKEGLTDTNFLSPVVHYFLFWSMSPCSHLPSHLLELWSLPCLQSLQSSQCQSYPCPMREGTDWQEASTGTGEADSKGSCLFLNLTWAEPGLGKIQDFNLCIVPWTSYISYPSGGQVLSLSPDPPSPWAVNKNSAVQGLDSARRPSEWETHRYEDPGAFDDVLG